MKIKYKGIEDAKVVSLRLKGVTYKDGDSITDAGAIDLVKSKDCLDWEVIADDNKKTKVISE